MPDRPNLVYRYDGTFPGLLCCLAECFHDKALPQAIQLLDEPQATLFPVKAVDTKPELAKRVELSIGEKISPEALYMARQGFLTCMEEKELCIIRFLLLGYKHGAKVTKLSTSEDVHVMDKALRYLNNEAHFHLEFLRFSDLGGVLVSEITPNNNVLPLIAGHFCDRFPEEDLMIFDKTHGLGFYARGSRREFFQADQVDLPPPDEAEESYRALWRKFYDSVAIEGRLNPKLRRTHMPMRYWGNTVELTPLNS